MEENDAEPTYTLRRFVRGLSSRKKTPQKAKTSK